MIPAIKESNQLKAFIGIRDNCPEYYNDTMDKIKTDSQDQVDQFFSINLKDYTTPSETKDKNKNELLKFITGPSKVDTNSQEQMF